MHLSNPSKVIIFTILLALPMFFYVPITTSADETGKFLLNEISPWPSDDVVWVEIINKSDETVALDGWQIAFVSGFSYTFPDGFEEIPPDGFHTLQISGNTLNADGDGCVLSSPDGPVDAVTWGNFIDTDEIPIETGPAVGPGYGFYGSGREYYAPDDVIFRLPLSWMTDQTRLTGNHNWIFRSSLTASKGSENPPPPPIHFSPSDGEVIASDFMLTVDGFDWSTQTTFQLATDDHFQDIVHEETVAGYHLAMSDLPAGTYFWRVKGFRDTEGPWTNHLEFTRLDFNIEDLVAEAGGPDNISRLPEEYPTMLASGKLPDVKAGVDPTIFLTSHHSIMVEQDTQRKDTMMICMDGCKMTGTYPWDSPQPINDDSNNSHGFGNCGMACLKMMASAHGCSISQDRIAYHMMEGAGTASFHANLKGQLGNPFEDLNHGVNGGLYSQDAPLLVSWLYGQPASASKEVFYNANTFYNNSPEMDSIAEFFADNRPVLRHMSTHVNLIAGAAVANISGLGEFHFVEVYDTDVMGNIRWIDHDSTSAVYNEFTFPPTTGRITRNDEEGIWQDSDEDGLVDFDETVRLGTDPNDKDTDMDDVNDKEDVLGYLFYPGGEYFKRQRDYDGDGRPKELDPDNDDPNDNSAWDSCEDRDHDGFITSGTNESSCFDLNDDFENVNPDCFRGYIKLLIKVDDVRSDGSVHYKFTEQVIIEAGEEGSDAYVHQHRWTYDLDCYGWGSATAHERDQGHARVRLDHDEITDEYFLIVDSDTPLIDLDVHVVTPVYQTFLYPPPSYYWFDNDARWPLGPAQYVDGGVLCKGEWLVENHLFTWEIWVESPD